ncbi:hypothetical protein [Flavobacterium sp.]|uniref:hypothetical protein n=1 Tax=Flavobacterium sp. TaxID=239 RepID=UPI0039E5E7C1
MGWKTSLIIIENKHHFTNDNALIEALGFDNLVYKREATFEETLHPEKNTFAIGYHRDNIIISDGHQLTNRGLEKTDGLKLAKYEQNLTQLFPDAEILTVACYSTSNFHGYSLIQNGDRQRLKIVGEGFKKEWGVPLAEENQLYQNATQQDGEWVWQDDDDTLTEDQLMEDFTFTVAKRRLGVRLDEAEGEDLLENTPFKVYEFLELPVNGLERRYTAAQMGDLCDDCGRGLGLAIDPQNERLKISILSFGCKADWLTAHPAKKDLSWPRGLFQ